MVATLMQQFAVVILALWLGLQPTYAAPIDSSSPTSPSFAQLAQQAFTATNQGDFATAEHLWTQLLAQDPENPALWTNRGNARVSQRHLEQALADFDQAITLAPDAPDPYLNRGVALEGLHRWAEALADDNQVIARDPQDAMAYNNRGNAHAGLGEWEEALADYRHAADLEPKFSFAQANYALTLYQLGQTDPAMQAMRNLVRRYPQFADMRAALAVSLWHDHRHAEAESHWVAVEGLDRRYGDRQWLVDERRWPPSLITAWDEFKEMR